MNPDSEGSCDTENWSNGCWKFSFAITGINVILRILRYIQTKKQNILLFFTVFLIK